MKLIKIGEEFILTNKQEIKIGDVTLEKHPTGYYYMPKIVMEYQLNDNSGIKVIASTNNLCEGVYSLSLKNIQKALNPSVEDLAEKSVLENKDYKAEGFSEYQNGKFNGFIEGFLKALELNKDKQFTYDDMVMIYNLGRDEKSKSQVMGKYYDTHKEWIEMITKKESEWDVEIEMRSKNIDELRESKEGFLNNPNLHVPVIENGYINIIKIIRNETN